MHTIEENLQTLKQRIREYEKKYHRKKDAVTLLAASKGQSAEKIKTAYLAGQKAFGENYLQEALKKMGPLAELPIEWYFIGRIQRNKVKKIAEHFDWVLSVADIETAQRLSQYRSVLLPPLNICIEVNISDEQTKAGVDSNHVLELANVCNILPQLKLRGLMAIPAPQTDFAQNRKTFHKLSLLANELAHHNIEIDILSMGMSNDFEAAIAEGATMVRIGSAIFGERL